MKEIVNSNLIAANSFLSTYQDVLSKKQVIKYVEKASTKLNDELDIVVGSFDVENFIKQYDNIVGVDMYQKDVFLKSSNDIREIINTVRKPLPKEIKDILDETGRELMIEETNKVLAKK